MAYGDRLCALKSAPKALLCQATALLLQLCPAGNIANRLQQVNDGTAALHAGEPTSSPNELLELSMAHGWTAGTAGAAIRRDQELALPTRRLARPDRQLST
ncbi:hypothetical protein [Novosphingobium sp. 9U]|uniref:hypothetical protein n=1 Tax=Novosphingobium sp. 9U TaxID=2653158 RepID=UPI0012F3073F|nr:hypothetical protein [Novosphingobium sp. 9U]VWX50869.1 hypothetical protein NOVOSPHI9U_350012 [Novosphingobium sp. 9U]